MNLAETAAKGIGSVGALALLAVLVATPAGAQTAPPTPASASVDQPSYLTPIPIRDVNPLLTPSREYMGIPAAGWMFYPEALIGTFYNDNLMQTQTGRIGAAGVRLQGDIDARRVSGKSTTEAYGSLEGFLYPSKSSYDTFNGKVGLSQTWEVQPDLIIKGQAEFDRLSYLTVGGQLVTPGGGTAWLTAPQQSQQAQASLAVQKSFGRFFAGASLNETRTIYDSLSTSAGKLSQSYRDSLTSTITARGGYWFSPMLYGYAEAAENWRQYSNDPFNSNGYRAVAGLGSDRIGLLRGEIYAGYQRQYYQAPLSGMSGSPVYGGKIYYYPTRAWTLTASLDESFSDSSNPTPSNPRGDPARVTSAQLKSAYQLSANWSLNWVLRYDHSNYLGVSRVDDTLTSDLTLNVLVARNINVALDYTRIELTSNAPGASYFNNVVSLSGVYKF